MTPTIFNPYRFASGGVWYDHTEYTNPSYIWARSLTQGGHDFRWQIPIVKITGGAGNTLNAMDVYFNKVGSPTLQMIGRVWDLDDPPNILGTLNFLDSASGTYITGGDISATGTDFEYHTATLDTPMTMTDSMGVGWEALNGESMTLAYLLANYIRTAYENVGANSSYYNGWSASGTDVAWLTTSPYRFVQRLY